jgi:hypothetical protein
MPSKKLVDNRVDFADGTIRQMVIWELSSPVEGSSHPYKYRLFFGVPGKRLIGYDNERGKGDHRHIEGREEPYRFRGIEQLVLDFWDDIDRWRASSQDADDLG